MTIVNKLPRYWVKARVGDLVDFGPRTEAADNTAVGFVPMQRLGTRFREHPTFELRRWGEVKQGYTHFKDEDVLLARITPCFENGKAGIARGLPNGLGAGSTEYFVCRPRERLLLPDYLLAYFKTRSFLAEGEKVMSGAVGQQRVPKHYLLDSEIALAPISEQRRIASKLGALFARMDSCRERLDAVPSIVKRLRESVIAAAVSGELTGHWRHERGAAANWAHDRYLRDLVVEPLRNGKSVRDGSGIKVLRLSCLKHGVIDWTQTKRGDWSDVADPKRFLVEKGDFLVSRGNGSRELVGRGSLASVPPEEVAFPDTMIRVRPDVSHLAPAFLKLIWESRSVRRQIEQCAKTTAGIWKISQSDLESIQLSIPSVDEQKEIVRRAEKLLESATVIADRLEHGRQTLQMLVPSTLSKAFRGELVEQEPGDEPASELLARIRRDNAVATTGRQQKGLRRKK